VTVGIAATGWFVLALIVVPPPAFLVSMVMATGRQDTKWRRLAWVSGLLGLVSVALVVYFFATFDSSGFE
jgi:uncharacterized membrane protein YdjX (TVP38/TMEM64 family)